MPRRALEALLMNVQQTHVKKEKGGNNPSGMSKMGERLLLPPKVVGAEVTDGFFPKSSPDSNYGLSGSGTSKKDFRL